MAADDTQNIMPTTIGAARAGVTTGEWAQALHDAFGEYRAPGRSVSAVTMLTRSGWVASLAHDA